MLARIYLPAKTAKHGSGEKVYLVEFEYRPDAA